ncbi:MAG TPA: DUF4835 family protein [Bacteroidales bacterium]|nr:DUF4835 family protein [Bacteroidales bacterium]
MLKGILFILIVLLDIYPLLSQEINCRISVSSQQVQGVSKEIFQSMQKDLYEFVNNTKWTNNVFSNEERIECTMFITISKAISIDEFQGTIQIQSTRPVYNTGYNTMIFNFKDNDFHVHYSQFVPLQFNENGKNTDLVSIIAYYVYIILGYDYDTFSLYGGTPYFLKAGSILNNCQNNPEKGWKAYESQRNRYWLVENLLDKKYKPLREYMYKYHRLGLDIMSEKSPEGRTAIAEGLKLLQKVYREQPGNFTVKLFFDAKSDELVNIFKESFPDEQARVINILKEIDPANSGNYDKIRKKM